MQSIKIKKGREGIKIDLSFFWNSIAFFEVDRLHESLNILNDYNLAWTFDQKGKKYTDRYIVTLLDQKKINEKTLKLLKEFESYMKEKYNIGGDDIK